MRVSNFAVAWAVAIFSSPMAAQAGQANDVQERNDCRLAAQVIRTGNPAPHRDWAYSFITGCAEEGPAVIVEQWRTQSTPDERALQRLMTTSAYLRTRAVFEAVSAAAADRARGHVIRIHALGMLYNYAAPQWWISTGDLLRPRENRLARVSTRSGDGDRVNAPDLGDARPEVEALLQQLIASDADSEVVRAAREVLRQLQTL
jgi:hypothetical protein